MTGNPNPEAATNESKLAWSEALALTWLQDFRATDAFARLDEAAQREIEGAVRVGVRSFVWRWNRPAAAPYSIEAMTAQDAVDVLVEQLPHTVCAIAASAVTMRWLIS